MARDAVEPKGRPNRGTEKNKFLIGHEDRLDRGDIGFDRLPVVPDPVP